MRLGIDASNTRAGGGLTYIIELLKHAEPHANGVDQVVIWASALTLSKLPETPWLIKRSHSFLNRSFLFRIIWQKYMLDIEAKKSCDILFLPSGNTSDFHPYVSMCQNLLPFESNEKAYFRFSWIRIRYELLRMNQSKSFKNADGVIFLSKYSLNVVERACCKIKNTKIIPHGVSDMFRVEKVMPFSTNQNINVLYVSIINFYKHQDKLVKAIYQLIDEGYALKLTLIGPSYKPALKALKQVINKRPDYSKKIILIDKIPYYSLPDYYRENDLFVFASSCETFGMILLEAMAGGSTIACSNLSSMQEVAGDSAIYFNPHNEMDIASAIRIYLEKPKLRKIMSERAISRSNEYSWEKCAKITFSYLSEIYRLY